MYGQPPKPAPSEVEEAVYSGKSPNGCGTDTPVRRFVAAYRSEFPGRTQPLFGFRNITNTQHD